MTPSTNAPQPQTTFAFDVRALDHPGVHRTIELLGDQTLADLHGVIEEEFELDDEHLWAFYLSGEWHDGDSEFGRSGRAHDVALRALDLEPGHRIAHLHDFGEEWRHVVEVARVGTVEPGAEYPRVTARIGEVDAGPDREDDEELEGEPFAPGLLAEIERSMDARGGEDRAARDRALAASAKTVEAALDACPTKRRLEQLGRSVEGPFPWWVDDVVRGLARAGSTSQAVSLMKRIAEVLEYEPFTVEELGEAIEVATAWNELDYEADIDLPAARLAERVHALCAALPTPRRAGELSSLVGCSVPQFLSRAVDQLAAAGQFDAAREAAVWLSHAGRNPGELVTVADHLTRADRKDEARRLLAEAAALPYALSAQDSWLVARGFAAAGDDATAEERVRGLAARRWITAQDREAAVGLLAEILERSGRAPEARAVEAEHAAWLKRRLEARGGTVRRAEPKTGRNDPCPCGSGKKFKKCCG